MPAPLLVALPLAVASRVVRRALRARRGPHAGSSGEVAAIVRVARREQAGAELAGGWRAEREGPMVVLSGRRLQPAAAVAAAPPDVVTFDRWTLSLDVVGAPPAFIGSAVQCADADVVGERLTVRAPAPGDRVEIDSGSKTVSDALAEAGVPRRLRSRWPVVAVDERVAMIPGVRTSAWAWRRPDSTRYLVARIAGPVGETAWSDSKTS